MTGGSKRSGASTRKTWRIGLAVVALLVAAMLYGLARPGLADRSAPTNRSLRIGITQ